MSVYWSICPSVYPLVHLLVHPSRSSSKWQKHAFLQLQLLLHLSMLDGGCGCGEGGGWMPLPTRLRRFCDPASFFQQSSINCYLTAKKCSQGHEFFWGHQQQVPKGILAHGSYLPAILWQCLMLKDDFQGLFFPIFDFRTQFLALKVLRFG